MVYIIENNGVYGLTKGQFSATAELGLSLKNQGINRYMPVDIAWEALVGNATFVARSFAGDPKQVKELIKAGLSHDGIAILDIISPCVTFNNRDEASHSYAWGKLHEVALHELSYVPPAEDIMVEYDQGASQEVTLHDGSTIILKKLDRDYDPTDRSEAIRILEEANLKQWLLTGLIYIDTKVPSLIDISNIIEKPLNRLTPEEMRPDRDSLAEINNSMFH